MNLWGETVGKAGKKIQRIDFSASDWLGGTAALSFAERGLYITICALIYVAGGPITKADLRKANPGRTDTFNALLLRLVDAGKISLRDGIIDQVRCERELARARHRIDKLSPGISTEPGSAGQNDGSDSFPAGFESDSSPHVSNKINEVRDPLRARNLPGVTKEKEDFIKPEDSAGRSAPAREGAQDDVRPPTEQEKAEIAELVEQTRSALAGEAPKAIRDPVAYRAAVAENKFRGAYTSVNRAAARLDGTEREEAWRVAAAAEIAGSWAAMMPADRKLLRQLWQWAKCLGNELEQAA